jgi:NAD(P)-dependent dehydrogenase (short-subunit alcohol dehydrogenase family)
MFAAAHLKADISHDDYLAHPETIGLVTGAASGIGLALVKNLLADSSLSLLFAGCRKPEEALTLQRLAADDDRLQLLTLDVTDEQSIKAAVAIMQGAGRLDLVLNTVGVLHTPEGLQPEKRLADINFDDLLLAFDVNALSSMRLALALEPLLKASRLPRFAALSARVGSIEDNRLGGWYAYRTSKAALNMLLRTLAIEWSRSMPTMRCVALHPGTVATELSAPFVGSKQEGVFTPDEAARHLLTVLEGISPEGNGGFYAWDGKEIPW